MGPDLRAIYRFDRFTLDLVRGTLSAADGSEALTHAGDPAEAEREIRLALSLDPFHPLVWRSSLGRALLVAGRLEKALAELRFCARQTPGYSPVFIRSPPPPSRLAKSRKPAQRSRACCPLIPT
jgi:hypothetical protein